MPYFCSEQSSPHSSNRRSFLFFPLTQVLPIFQDLPNFITFVFHPCFHLGDGLHFWISVSLSAQPCLTLCDSMDCSLPGSSVHGLFQARILERVVISSSRGSSWPRDQPKPKCLIFRELAGRFFAPSATWEALVVMEHLLNSWSRGSFWVLFKSGKKNC